MKRVSIIGGGISGLAVLHYLKQRLGEDADITLFEREPSIGGTIRSFQKGSRLFEWGPNGFLDNQPATLKFIDELGIKDQVIEASASSCGRYIQIKGRLQKAPMKTIDLIRSPLLTLIDKCSLITGLFKKNISKDTSIHEYVSRRFSANIAETLVDPMISGIYAGNIRRLHMACAFPKFKSQGFKKTRMCSFKRGMGQVVEALEKRYEQHIRTNTEISPDQINADINIVAVPAYAAAKIVENLNPVLSQLLSQAPYAPIAVAGLVFKKGSFRKVPDGFGYLIPSKDNKDILGVLIESNVYTGRAEDDEIMVRVMLGGAHHPALINDQPDQIIAKALKEIDGTYGLNAGPLATFIKIWPKAIPQYELDYPQWRRSVAEQCAKVPGLHLCANYLDGISFNDCINNAKALALSINL